MAGRRCVGCGRRASVVRSDASARGGQRTTKRRVNIRRDQPAVKVTLRGQRITPCSSASTTPTACGRGRTAALLLSRRSRPRSGAAGSRSGPRRSCRLMVLGPARSTGEALGQGAQRRVLAPISPRPIDAPRRAASGRRPMPMTWRPHGAHQRPHGSARPPGAAAAIKTGAETLARRRRLIRVEALERTVTPRLVVRAPRRAHGCCRSTVVECRTRPTAWFRPARIDPAAHNGPGGGTGRRPRPAEDGHDVASL